MKASYRWLCELLPAMKASPSEVAKRFTHAGIEIEGTSEYGAGTESCVVARVTAVRPHPTKSGLRLVTIDRGGPQEQEVVCGAPNVPEPGGLVVLAPLGAHLPAKNLTIAPRAIAGVTSEGMLCSEAELGLSEDQAGIIVLPVGTAAPGTPLSEAVPNARDTIFEVGLTPNRPDGLGHVGLARELAALLEITFAFPDPGAVAKTSDVFAKDLCSIEVKDADRCPHYGASVSLDVTIGPSPLWVRYRLQALGVRSISNVVDITNVVMLEYGHPLHAFDLDRVRSRTGAEKPSIVVRCATEGEILKTLDGVDRKLVTDDLLICDGQGPVGIAGVMGGANSEIQSDTKRVLYECAWFDPRSIRRTARRHAMHTESSHRFERGVDPGHVASVLDRVAALTTTLAGASAARGRVHVQGTRVEGEPLPVARRSLRFRGMRVREVTGVDVPFATSVAILKRLEFAIEKEADGACEVHVPTHRPDVGREVDLVEEVIRVLGMDGVPAELPPIHASRDVGGREELARRAKEISASLGLSEAITFSFTSARVLEILAAPAPAVTLENPMSEHQSVLRTTLLVGLLDAVKNARRHGERDVREFTVGPVFLTPKGSSVLPEERLRLAFAIAGDRPAWLEKPKAFDVWDAKGYVLEIARRLTGLSVTIVPATRADAPKHLHPRGAAFVEIGGARVGSFGPLHPDAVDALELDGELFVFEMDLDGFTAGAALPKFSAIPRFPASSRDVALVVKDGIPAGDVEAAVRDAAGPLAEAVALFDRFVGGQVPQGHASLAFRVVYRSPDRTLTDAEVDAAHANVVAAATARFGATLRA